MTLADPDVTVLGPDPSHRTCVLNGNAFQQDAIQSCNGWQYACFYAALPGSDAAAEPLFVHLARRRLPRGPWETLVFHDYPQTTDDGHNTVQIGICPGDGTIHLSYDHHCDRVRYRHSIPNVATSPDAFKWDAKLFTATLPHLPGLEHEPQLFTSITYPRFGPLGNDLWYSWRTGKAGLGDDHLCIYRAATGRYELPGNGNTGMHLQGVNANPYIHGLHARGPRLYTTWVYRGFVWYDGWDDPADTKHKRQAGPNGAENNHDICFAYSEDEGRTWCNGAGDRVADLARGEAVMPDSPGIVAFNIPKGSGLINQESQAVDHHGGVHVLNRDNRDGELRRKHYYRSPEGTWTQRALPHVSGAGKRGQVAVSRDDDLYFVLPDTTTSSTTTLTILKASKSNDYATYELVWQGKEGAFPPTEPLVDIVRLDHDNVLSVYTRATAAAADEEGAEAGIDVVVLDFQL